MKLGMRCTLIEMLNEDWIKNDTHSPYRMTHLDEFVTSSSKLQRLRQLIDNMPPYPRGEEHKFLIVSKFPAVCMNCR